jgi:hypothetical protein
MPKARMLAGGIVEPGAGLPGAVLAYVAVSGGPKGSRLFRVDGPPGTPKVEELSPETTIDLSRFSRETESELQPVVAEIERCGGVSVIAIPSPSWICDEVREFLKASEGLAID